MLVILASNARRASITSITMLTMLTMLAMLAMLARCATARPVTKASIAMLALHQEVPTMPVTILFANNKGGVQKTGCTVQTAAGLARQGLNVLVVDMDPQANATRRLGIEWDPANPIPSISEAIAANAEGAAEGAVIECGWKTAD